MVSSLRYSTITNGTGAAVVAGGALVSVGQDYAAETVDRILVAADVGAGAGQTQHAAGMIFAEFKGAVIKKVISASIVRTAGNFDYFYLGTDIITANIGFQIVAVNANGVSTLRLIDGAAAAAQLAAGDHIIVVVELGNS